VWQKAIVFGDSIYSATRNFPADERFGLTQQMRRAAVSISSNIAEGASRMSDNDFGRFIEIGTGSLFEVVSQSFIALKQDFLSEDLFQVAYRDAEELSRMLSGLRRSLHSK
jgi:four helix bundle protein